MKLISSSRIRGLVLMLMMLMCVIAQGRVGGAGGHGGGGHSSGSHSSHSSSHSSYSHSYSSHSYGGGGGGGSIGTGAIVVIIVVLVILYLVIRAAKANNSAASDESYAMPESQPFPEGLDEQKISTAFMAIQDAWQRQDLAGVRRWLSDGMYQRLTLQIQMMRILGQKNLMKNIQVGGISIASSRVSGNYQTVEVAIAFSMDDSFISNKYPQFNEEYTGDSAIEYWTFIKRTDAEGGKDLYANGNCPNCGATFEVKMGEICRCSNCNTMTNSAAYDWILSEITQSDDFTGGAGMAYDAHLKELTQNDPFFAVQRMEDIASNVFVQVMECITSGNKKRLHFFADEQAVAQVETSMNNRRFVFDRFYINSTTISSYMTANGMLQLDFNITATYRRADLNGGLRMLDNDFVTSGFWLQLSRNVDAIALPAEVAYSYECSNCGAPFEDTTQATCTYCDSPVVDKKRNWVLTGINLDQLFA
jgi:predicted lipid-binding transport protein (Tim44 family)/DNA-directed RNA polymerase subunit RPC12/RpoP